MKTFIQLRDGVGFATLIVPDGEPDHSVTPDHTTAVEVFTDNPDQFLKMKYDEKTKSWSEAELYVFAELDDLGRVIELRRTYFLHEADGKPLLSQETLRDLRPDWTWDGEKWNIPQAIDHNWEKVAELMAQEPKPELENTPAPSAE